MRHGLALLLLAAASTAACGGKSIRTGDNDDAGGTSGTGGSGGTATGGFPSGGTGGGASTGGTAGTGGQSSASLRRGINLGNRLDAPYEGAWGPILHDTDFVHIASRGFDHVRLPVRFNAHAESSPPYTIDEIFFERVDWAIQNASANGLSIVVDFHHYEEIHLSPEAHVERFLGIWDQIATRYRDQPASVVFELLNEPNGALNSHWNDYAARAIQVIRRTNPTRLLIVDAEEWAGPTAIGRLALPPNDPNVIASIHAYDPVLFTLQGAEFAGAAFSTTGVLYPGPPSAPLMPSAGALAESWVADWFQRYNTSAGGENPSSPAQIGREFSDSLSFTTSTGHAVYNGEWGCTQNADLASRVQWMHDVRAESERLGMGWAVWDDGGGISLFNADTGTWNEELLKTLFD